MKINFRKLYAALEVDKKEDAARMAGMARQTWSKLEKIKDLPSKFVFQLAIKKKDVRELLPKDFFFYNSFVLRVNMAYYNVSVYKLMKLNENCYSYMKFRKLFEEYSVCYELKDLFTKAFGEMVIPIMEYPGGYRLLTAIDTDNTLDFSEKLFIPVIVDNDMYYPKNTPFNKTISYLYNNHLLNDYKSKEAFDELKNSLKEKNVPCNIVLAKMNEKNHFELINT